MTLFVRSSPSKPRLFVTPKLVLPTPWSQSVKKHTNPWVALEEFIFFIIGRYSVAPPTSPRPLPPSPSPHHPHRH